MRDQLFLSGMTGQLDIDRLKKMLGRGKANLKNKPSVKPYPVLWTSTIMGKSTDWMDWCSHEMPQWLGDQGVVLEVVRRPRLYLINSDEAWESLCDEFAVEQDRFMGSNLCKIDWVKVQKKYDAIWHDKGRYAPSWDVESTAWLDTSFLKIKQVVDINKGCQYDWDSNEPNGGYKPPSIIMARMIKNISNRYLNG